MTGRQHSPAQRAALGAVLAGAGAAGLVSAFAFAPLADAAPTPATDRVVPQVDETSTGAQTTAPAVEPNYGFKKLRIGVQQKQGSYVPDDATTVGTKISITQSGGLLDKPVTTECVTEAGTRVESDAPSASFCDFKDDGFVSRTAAKARSAKAVRGPVVGNPPISQAYLIEPGATVTITETKATKSFLIDPASPVTVEPCEVEGESSTCAAEQVVLENPGIAPVAKDDSATTEENTAVTIGIAGNDTANAPINGVKIAADPKHGTARLIATESDEPEPGASASASASASESSAAPTVTLTQTETQTETQTATETVTEVVTTTSTAVLTLNADRRLAGSRSLAAVTSYRAVYTPERGFTGVDTFRYSFTTDNGTATATVRVTVTGGGNDASDDANGRDPIAETGTDSGELLLIGTGLLAVGGAVMTTGVKRRRGRHAR